MSSNTTTTNHSTSLAIAAASAAAAAAATTLLLSASWRSQRQSSLPTAAAPQQSIQIEELERQVEKWKELRQAERNGRTRAEARLRELQLAAVAKATMGASPPDAPADNPTQAPSSQPAPSSSTPDSVWPLRPIGRLRSVFAGRNGTPRQPLRLAPSARAVLQLSPWVPADALEGLENYTHVWLIYAFHANTDAGKAAAKAASGAAATTTATTITAPSFRAKVHVPRLDGGRLGVLATRSPHRPCPIGLSAARLLAVLPGGRLLLGGADVVDGTPVLDVKPYVPFCDSVEGAKAPAWVAAEAAEEGGGGGGGGEPLRVAEVVVSAAAEERLTRAWEAVARNPRKNKGSLYDEPGEFLALVREVLARDIRSAHQRLRARKAAAAALAANGGGGGVGAGGEDGDNLEEGEDLEGRWHVVLDGVDVSYAVDAAGRVLIRNATPAGRRGGGDGGNENDDDEG